MSFEPREKQVGPDTERCKRQKRQVQGTTIKVEDATGIIDANILADALKRDSARTRS